MSRRKRLTPHDGRTGEAMSSNDDVLGQERQHESGSDELLTGAEVLLVDSDARVRDGFRKLLGTVGLIVTATEDRAMAIELASEKHFAVAIVDVDSPEPNAGYALMEVLAEKSPATAVVLLTARQTFSAAVEGFRRGAADVVAKAPENVQYLSDTVIRHCRERRRSSERDALLATVLDIHEEFLQRLMDASKAKVEAEERHSGHSTLVGAGECVVLVVDQNPNTAEGLQRQLGAGYRIAAVQTGGEALDFVGQQAVQLVLVTDELPDLPGSMVAKSVRAEANEAIVLLFSHPDGDRPGRADIVELTRSIELLPELKDGAQLVEQIHELRQAVVAKGKERHYLQAFRRDHYDFLRRYVELRQRLSAQLAD